MAARFEYTAGSDTQWLSVPWDGSFEWSFPYCIGCFYKAYAVDNDYTMVQLADTTDPTNYTRLNFNDGGLDIQLLETQGAVGGEAHSSIAPTANVWQHAMGNYKEDSGDVWLNGANKGSYSTSVTSINTSIDELAIGFENDQFPTSSGDGWHGELAEVFVYHGEASDQQVQLLARGATPWDVFDQNRLFYVPLLDNFRIYGGWHKDSGLMTPEGTKGTPRFVDHPPQVADTRGNMDYLANVNSLIRELG